MLSLCLFLFRVPDTILENEANEIYPVVVQKMSYFQLVVLQIIFIGNGLDSVEIVSIMDVIQNIINVSGIKLAAKKSFF